MTTVRHFFVDEAGDLALFNRRKQVVVGTPGSSWCFMLGVAELPDPEAVTKTLEELRARLLADRYFAGVPSMHPSGGKTALAFHAKDDLPEVRREVFALLPSFNAKVLVAIRRKMDLVRLAQEMHRVTGRKLTSDFVYDDLVARLFKNMLHKADENRIWFSKRGKSDRNTALTSAIGKAKSSFNRSWGTHHDKPTTVSSAAPSDQAGLQVIDYYLWALQRMLERRESRHFDLVSAQYRFVMDMDDRRRNAYGEWYSDKNPLTLEKMMPTTLG